jgi:hypothetical protein
MWPPIECHNSAITNLGPMGRPGHRAETHGGWHKRQPEPGYFVHRSPNGYLYLVTNQGTLALGRPPSALQCGRPQRRSQPHPPPSLLLSENPAPIGSTRWADTSNAPRQESMSSNASRAPDGRGRCEIRRCEYEPIRSSAPAQHRRSVFGPDHADLPRLTSPSRSACSIASRSSSALRR